MRKTKGPKLRALIDRSSDKRIQDKENTNYADHVINQLQEDPHEAHLQGENP